jgi:putative salt-induced outer membrane protein
MKCLKLLIICFIFCFGIVIFADGFTGDASFGLSTTSGNSDTMSLSFTFNANTKIDNTKKWLNKGGYLKAEQDGNDTADNLVFLSRLEWTHSDKFYSYYEVGYLKDKFKDYDYRITPSAGLGYVLFDNGIKSLKFTGGLSEVMISYKSINSTDSYGALTVGNEFKWKISNSADFAQNLKITSDISDFNKYFLVFNMDLSVAINKTWGVKLAFTDNYDNEPVSDTVKKNDTVFIAGITYKF